MANMLHGTGISTYICLRCIIKCWQIFPTWSILEHLSMWLFPPPPKMFHPIHPNQKNMGTSAPSCTPASCKVCRPGNQPTTLQFPSLEKQKYTPLKPTAKKNLKKTRAVWLSGRCSGAFEVFLFLGKGIHQLSSRVTRTHQNSKKQLQVSLKVSCFFFEHGKLLSKLEFGKVFKGNVF